MKTLDGKAVAAKVRAEVKKQAEQFPTQPGLAVILVGDDPASQVYVASKIKACGEVGIASFEHRLVGTAPAEALKSLIEKLNKDPKVHGILVQLPLPKHLTEAEVLSWIDAAKDVDGLTDVSAGLLAKNKQIVAPCTPAGVMEILKHYGYDVRGMNAVVVGRSHIVGQPMAQLLLHADATVTVVHSKTKNIREHTSKADLIVVAAGKPRFMGKEDFKDGAIVIDVGIHRGQDKKLCGDVRFDELSHVEAATPVPGGVGPMTIAMLMKNTLELCKEAGRE